MRCAGVSLRYSSNSARSTSALVSGDCVRYGLTRERLHDHCDGMPCSRIATILLGRAMDVVLVPPEIPHNPGCAARLCAATGNVLHLVEPLGFSLADRYLKRAGLDYWPHVEIAVHRDWNA